MVAGQTRIQDFTFISLSGNTEIANVVVESNQLHTALPGVSLSHQAQVNLTHRDVTSSHQLFVAGKHVGELDSTGTQVSVNLPQQDITVFAPLVSGIHRDATLLAGSLSAQAQVDLVSRIGSGQLGINNSIASFQDFVFEGLTFAPHFSLDSGGLQLPSTILTLETAHTGVKVTDISMQISATDNVAQANGFEASLLGGQLTLSQLYLDDRDQTLTFNATDIDLASLLQLQQQAGVQGPGIAITGSIGGSLPVAMVNGRPQITDASLINLAPGKLVIKNNAAFDNLKLQQPQLSAQLALLENLEYDSLTSEVAMSPDGLVNLNIALKGINPEQQQPLHFNYTHEQNLYTLLRSLRLTNQIKETIERRLTQSP